MSNLYKAKLQVSHLGIYFGTFAPCHLGHYDNIVRAKRENDACLVIVSGRTGDRGDKIGLDLKRRFRYMRELFADDENVYIAYLDEANMPEYPGGWTEWLAGITQVLQDSVVTFPKKITWYVGEESYVEELRSRTNDKVVQLDRSIIPISATKIRANPLKYWHYITRPFRKHFSTNILVIGTPSVGKTTLVRDLARILGSPFTDEYARRYEEHYNVRDDELDINDFNYIGTGQFELNKETIMSPANNGIFIADTDVMVTKVFTKYYRPKEEYEQLSLSFDMLIRKQKWELILVIPPVTKYVNDNFRDMNYADDQSRAEIHKLLMEEINSWNLMNKVVLLDATSNSIENDPEGFYARYEQAKKVIRTFIKERNQLDIL